jgi:hypothetical protein
VPGRLSFTRVKAAEASVRRAVRDPIRRARAGIPWTRRDTLLLLGGLVLLAVTAAFQVQPARPLPETELKMHLAELQLLPALSDDPRDSAQFFAEKLMAGWNPDTLFRSVHPDFWRRENGRGPNETVAGVVDGFRAFDAAHGRIITANGREGTLEFRTVRTRDGRDYLGNVVTLQAEFGDGTTRRITLTLIPSARRPGSWSIWEISAPPFLTP